VTQVAPFVTFVVVSEGSGDGHTALVASLSAQAPRSTEVVVVAPGVGLPERVNDAVSASAAEFVSIIRPLGTLAPDAVASVRDAVAGRSETGVVYADETVPADGRRQSVRRPIYSPERLRCQNYLGELVFYRRELFRAVGGLRDGIPGAEFYDLALRATRQAESVLHLAAEIFAVAAAAASRLTETELDSTRIVLTEYLAATGGGEVRAVNADGIHDTRRLVIGEPLVSIVIPTRGVHTDIDGDLRCFLVDAVRSIVSVTTWANYEIVLVIDSVAEQGVVDEVTALAGDRLRFVEWVKPFNFSEKVNVGVLTARGEYVLILNDDIMVITPDWVQGMLALAQLPGAGMVGCMLYYADDTIQHAGHHYHGSEVSHIGLDAPRGDAGPMSGFRVEREVAGVTAACALMPKSVFLEVGGLTNLLPGAFNDVDLCMKTTWQGHEIYWTPHSELYHYESKTRDAVVHGFEIDVAWRRWGFMMEESPYWPDTFSRPVN
jgi:hypothetical protein